MIIKKKNINKKVTPNKPKHTEAEKKKHWSNKKSCTDIRKKIWFFVR